MRPTNFTALSFACLAFFHILAVVSGLPEFNLKASKKRAIDEPSLRTNAARMARGLSPMKPRNLFKASRVAQRDSQPSSQPQNYNIRCKQTSTGGWVGYLSNAKPFTLATSNTNALVVSIPSAPFPTNIPVTGGAYPYLGFSGANLGGSDAFPITLTKAVSSGPAQTVDNSYSGTKAESSIWTYTSSNGAITPSWLQPSGNSQGVKLWSVNNVVNLVRSSSYSGSGYELSCFIV